MKIHYYDIESLDNIFSLANYKSDCNHVDLYWLCDDPLLTTSPDPNKTIKELLIEAIRKTNENFTGTIECYDLHKQASSNHMAKAFGLSDAGTRVNDPKAYSIYPAMFRPVCDTDPEYDPDVHPYLMGYNSSNYDTSMLSLYFYEAYPIIKDPQTFKQTVMFQPPTAKAMRQYSDEMFSGKFKECMPSRLACTYDRSRGAWSKPDYTDTKWKIRKSMLMTGRHLDVSKLNEKQQKLALKRICGMLGLSIVESDKLATNQTRINSVNDFLELMAYNVSDTLKLETLFNHRDYKAQFDLKKGLLDKYPELIYNKLPDKYAPDIRPDNVRRDRLTIDCSSADFSSRSLCPYGHLDDIKTVSFMYPSARKAAESGVPRVNVLDETRNFIQKHFKGSTVAKQFDNVYNYYKLIEGKNFNDSSEYAEKYPGMSVSRTSDLPVTNTHMLYYNKDGTPTSCYAKFGLGGIHGAEYNKALYDHDVAMFNKSIEDLEYVKSIYPDPIDLKKAKYILMPDFTVRPAKDFLAPRSTLKSSRYKEITMDDAPVLFTQSTKRDKNGKTTKGEWKINKKYTFTSADPTNHEDFTSYYPNMLIWLDAFWNEGLGYDRYAEIFEDKQTYGKLMKDKSLPEEERIRYSILREGTKLILNSASGAADANFYNPIRMNNMTMSMRIIGQLFTFRIAFAQAMQGAKVASTNTDGLFTVMEATKNNTILEREAADIHVEIEPEPTFLISKDSNNRLEMNTETGEIENVGGGTLKCRKGPNPTKALAHPAITDWALSEYLVFCSMNQFWGKDDVTLSSPFKDSAGENILNAALKEFDSVKGLTMFQNIISSSHGSVNYIFGTTDENPDKPIIMQHYNRVFIMKDKTPGTIHIQAANAKQITPAMIAKRNRDSEALQQHDPFALGILEQYGVPQKDIPINKEATIKKVTGIEPEWYIMVVNEDLTGLSDERRRFIYDNIDYEKYKQLLCDCFTNNWKNTLPPQPQPTPAETLSFEEKSTLLTTYNMQPMLNIVLSSKLNPNANYAVKSVEDSDVVSDILERIET